MLPGKTSSNRVSRQYLASAESAAGTNASKLSKVVADRAVLERYMIPFFGKSTIMSINAPKMHGYGRP